jgi:hypothetical protein
MPTDSFGKTAKAREKFADHLMAVANGVSISLMSGLLVVPLIAVARAIFLASQPLTVVGLFSSIAEHPVECAAFVIFYLVALGFVWGVRSGAARIYDEIEARSESRSEAVRRRQQWRR